MIVRDLMRAASGAFPGASSERVVDDGLDGPRTTPALGVAAEAAIDLPRRARQVRSRRHGGADIVVGQNIARADDHADGELVVMFTSSR